MADLKDNAAEVEGAAEEMLEEHSALGDVQAGSPKEHLDFLTSLILIGVSVAVIITSQSYYQQQLKRRMVTTFYESTGFMPTIFAGFLLIMSVILLVQSLQHASVKARLSELWQALCRTVKSKAVYKTIGGLAIFAIYIYGLLGRLYFGWASLIMLFVTLLYLYFNKKDLPKVLVKCLLISVLAVAGIVGLFQYAFSVPMP